MARHVLRDLDTGMIPAAGITPANAPEASVTDDIAADLEHAGPASKPKLPSSSRMVVISLVSANDY
jgi:hypothetical protein